MIRAIEDEHAPRPKARQRRRRRLIVAAGAILVVALLLQAPAIRTLIRHTHSALSGHAILVEGRILAYDTVEAAIMAARDEDLIPLPPGQTFDLGLVNIPSGKSITVRSLPDRGPPPVLTSSGSTPMGFIVGGSLTLRRVNLSSSGTGNRQPLFLLSRGTSVTLDGCRIEAHVDDAEHLARHARIFELLGGGAVELRRSEIATVGNIVAIGTTSGPDLQETARCSVVIDDSTVRSKMLVHLRHAVREDKPELDLRAERLDYEGKWILKTSPGTAIPRVDLDLDRSRIVTSRNAVFFQTDQVDIVRSRLKLRAGSNIYPAGNAYVEICAYEYIHRPERRMIPLASFDPKTGAPTVTGKPDGSITLKETGKKFASLMEALTTAPEGSTLVLSGRIVGPHAKIPDARSLNLEAAPGARPVITVMKDSRHSVRLRGPCSVRGIRFEGLFGLPGGRPLLDIDTSDGEATVEDCRFISFPYRDSTHHIALVMWGTEAATVRGCEFRSPGGTCVLPGTGCARIQLESCLLTGRAAFERRNRAVVPTRTIVVAQSCTFVCDHLVDYSTRLQFHPLDLVFRNCLLEIERSTFHLQGVDAPDLAGLFTWQGDRNVHSRLGPVLDTTPREARAGFEKTVVESFPALRSLGVKVQITGASHDRIFNREQFRAPINANSLIRALRPGIDSPAVEALRNLSR